MCDGCGKLIGAHGIGFKCTHGCDIDFCDECKDIVEEAVAKAGVESEPEELYRKVSALPVGASINVLGRDKIGMPYVKGKCTRKSDMEFECTWSDDDPNEIFKLVGDEDGIKNEFLLEYIKEDKKRSPEGGNGRKNAGGSPARRKKARQNEGGAEADGDADMVRLHASSQNAIQKLQDTDTSLSHLSLSLSPPSPPPPTLSLSPWRAGRRRRRQREGGGHAEELQRRCWRCSSQGGCAQGHPRRELICPARGRASTNTRPAAWARARTTL